jgi:hypothetical protein
VLVCSLVLAFAGPPIPTDDTPPSTTELAHWSSIPSPIDPPSEPTRPKVPNTGAGFITLGSLLLGGGGAMAFTGVGLAYDDTDNRTTEQLLGLGGAASMGAGTVILAIGLAIRHQYRASPDAAIPYAPHTGAGMQFGGIGVLTIGSVLLVSGAFDLAVATCTSQGCYQGGAAAAIQMGVGLAGLAAGSGLLIAGSSRRAKYKAWDKARTASTILPTFSVRANGLQFGVAGRF